MSMFLSSQFRLYQQLSLACNYRHILLAPEESYSRFGDGITERCIH